ncbi:hypothetical protein MAR_021982 [Mya arenaria]|uniref:Uncharacterized protein n=1 Tax=Mya arenaria TaxID=6604 RepID=A0ABY7E9E6_MYAAR|nr:hypothetical protein MAR_021982 [Mya arenaria]
MSLPVQRETGDIKIAWGELLLEIFRFHARETSALQLEDQREGFVLKMELVKLSSIAEEMRVGKKKSWTLIPDSSSRTPNRYITSRSLTADRTLPDEENKMDHRKLVDGCNWMYHNMTCTLCWIGIEE